MVNVLKITDLGATLKGVATYHDSCAALREYGIKREPRVLLEKVRGLEMREMKDTDACCGFGGSFSVKFEPIAVGMGEKKIENAEAVGAEYMISTDVSCLMHLDGYAKNAGKSVKMMHLCDVLASGWD
jgi:L-lactate dehydrogenase complex protein LldE